MRKDTELREGGCACGSVRYKVRGEPIMVHNCHCRLCQRQTGAASAINAFWESDRVEFLSGELAEAEFTTGSGKMQVVRRCAACGVGVVSHYPRLGRLLSAVRAGTLDDPGSVTPDLVIFTEEKMPWVALPPAIPQFPEYYIAREELSAEQVARLRALVEQAGAG